MRWLKEYGLISNIADYAALPYPVLQHARLLMAAQEQAERSAAVPSGRRR